MGSIAIYQIRNLATGDMYVGSSSYLEHRWYVHKYHLKRDTHRNIILQRVYNKTPDDLVFEVIEYCKSEELLQREQYWIDKLIPAYNLAKVAGSRLGMKSEPLSVAHRAKISSVLKGKRRGPLSDQHKLKIKIATSGKKRSEATKERLRQAALGKAKSVEHISKLHRGRDAANLRRRTESRIDAGWMRTVLELMVKEAVRRKREQNAC